MRIEVLRKWGRLSAGLVCEIPSHTGNIMINRGYAREVKADKKAERPRLRRRRRKKSETVETKSEE